MNLLEYIRVINHLNRKNIIEKIITIFVFMSVNIIVGLFVYFISVTYSEYFVIFYPFLILMSNLWILKLSIYKIAVSNIHYNKSLKIASQISISDAVLQEEDGFYYYQTSKVKFYYINSSDLEGLVTSYTKIIENTENNQTVNIVIETNVGESNIVDYLSKLSRNETIINYLFTPNGFFYFINTRKGFLLMQFVLNRMKTNLKLLMR